MVACAHEKYRYFIKCSKNDISHVARSAEQTKTTSVCVYVCVYVVHSCSEYVYVCVYLVYAAVSVCISLCMYMLSSYPAATKIHLFPP